MKVAHAETHVKGSSGLQDAKGFGIRTNAHAFKMLSSGLYSDKVGAVLRELACNAADAHIEAGTRDLAIEVKLPNRIDKQFHVKDWGPGLSHDDVMNLYTTYFASTKQNSNDFTGAFGLGSKSPFSYTDAFTVTSVHGGRMCTYTCHLGDEGVPTVAQLADEEAEKDWQHGLMVSFPVKPSDYQEFQNKAQEIFRWFRVTPRIVGAAAIKPIKYAFESAEFARYAEDSEPVNGAVGIVMGNVHYPIQQNKVTGLSLLGTYAFHIPNLILRVNIGDVQVAGSREELQYDKKDVAFLTKRLEAAARYVAEDCAKFVLAFEKADWATKCATAGISSKWVGRRYFNWAEFFKAAGLPDAAEQARVIDARHVPLPDSSGKRTSFRVLEPTFKGVRHDSYTEGYGPRDKHGNQARGSLQLRADTVVYMGNAPHALPRARSLILDKKHLQVVLVTPSSKKGGDLKAVQEEVDLLVKAIPGLEVKDIATVPVPPNYVAKGPGKRRAQVKNGQYPPLPSVDVDVWPLPGFNKQKVDISKVPADQLHFMVNRRYMVRVLDKSVDKDKEFEHKHWGVILKSVHELQNELGVGDMRYHVYMPVARVRAFDLHKRGWKTTFEFLREWMQSKPVVDAIVSEVEKWEPTHRITHPHDWVSALCWLHNEHRALYDKVKGDFVHPDLDKSIRDITKASLKAGSNAGTRFPPVVALYNALQSQLELPHFVMPATAKRPFLDPSDLNRQLVARHTLMGLHDGQEVTWLVNNQPDKLPIFMKYVQS